MSATVTSPPIGTMPGTLAGDATPGTHGLVPPGPATGPPQDQDKKFIQRDQPDPDEPRRKLVKRWTDRVLRAKKHWDPTFNRMRENQHFVEGRQWPDMPKPHSEMVRDDRYIANICIRHVIQRTAELYPNNPTMQAKRAPKLIATTWDGTGQQLQQAQQAMLMAAQHGMPPDPQSLMILQDAQAVHQFDQVMDRIGSTLKMLYDYNVREQSHSFKNCMKMTVRRGLITAVGYVKIGFQRAMRMRPEIEARIADMSERLAHIERLAADMADEEIEHDSADAEELRLAIQSLASEPQLIIREGLTFDYPDSTSIIPDPQCRSLRGFLGADWVAQEYLLTPDQIEEIYMVDVGDGYTAYDQDGLSQGFELAKLSHYSQGDRDDVSTPLACACVWEIYNRKDGLLYVVCDGYKDFLQEPGPPEVEISRFYPWFSFVFNEGYDQQQLYPQSDIDLIRDMQLELNRARQGLREHRRANRPKTAVAAGVLEQGDMDKLRTHPANALLELNSLSPGQKIDDVLQVIKMPPIDAAVYDTAPVFEDVLRVLGSDQADQGTTSDATATEVSVAQFSQNTDTVSIVDDINDTLSELARTASEILILNVSQETVQKTIGPGAVWPQINAQMAAENVFLEVDLTANGPVNRQQDVQHLVQLVPLLQRIPGVSPEWLAKQVIRRMGDDVDMSEAFAEGLPSMEALNQLMGRPPAAPGAPGPGAPGPGGAGKGAPRPPGPGQDPNAQGPAGSLPAPPAPGMTPTGRLGPFTPPMQVYGANGNRPGTGGGMPRPSGQGMPTP
jgi:hypothetical protein